MKQSIGTIFICFLFACSDIEPGKQEASQNAATAPDTSRKSIPASTAATINGTDISIKYHSPAVRGRVIWGGLVAYDQVWVTGAHSATTLEVSKEFFVQNKMLPAGKYAIFTIPSRDEWTVIINKNWDQHLADEYSEADDAVRIKVKPSTLNQTAERLKYTIAQAGNNKAEISISWEKIRLSFVIEPGSKTD